METCVRFPVRLHGMVFNYTDPIEQTSSSEANSSSASPEIPRILLNPNVHHRIHKTRYLCLFWARSIQSMLSTPHHEDPF